MRVLLLAPQPFYQERGTPIAVRMVLDTLSRTLGLNNNSAPQIDLLVYDEGEEIEIPGVRIIRTPTLSFCVAFAQAYHAKSSCVISTFSVRRSYFCGALADRNTR